MYELALFAGGGGGLLASKWLLGWRTVGYVEWDRYAIEVIKARIRDGYLDDAPIWSDVRSFTKRNNACRRFIRALRALADDLIITAGFPCQPFSAAGKRLGPDDPRNGWPATIRIIREIRPRFCLLENVPGLLANPYFGTVLGDLAESGYDARWDCIPASAVGANHQRDRLWIVAHARSQRHAAALQHQRERGGNVAAESRSDGAVQFVADTYGWGLQIRPQLDGESPIDSAIGDSRRGHPVGCCDEASDVAHSESKPARRLPGRTGETVTIPGSGSQTLAHPKRHMLEKPNNIDARRGTAEGSWWSVEPAVGRVVDGLAHRVDQLRATGNGQVPDVVAVAWRLLSRP